MSLNLQTTTAVIDENGVLRGLEPLMNARGETVQIVIIRLKEEAVDTSQISEKVWHRGIASNPAFAFLKEETEDVYSWEDGVPLPVLREPKS